ncbi:MAG: response regulator [bacterium]
METQTSVLVADDHENILHLFKDIFKKTNYRIFLASNGMEALETAIKHKVDLAYLDVKMPIMDGLETLAQWKQIQPATQIVMISAYNDEKLVQKAIEQGAFTYLFKPINIVDIYAITFQCLKNIGVEPAADTLDFPGLV